MYLKLNLKDEWFLDPKLSARELRFLMLLHAVKSQYKTSVFRLKREWICEQLNWSDPVAVSQVSASLQSKNYLIKKRVGDCNEYTIFAQNDLSEEVSDHLPLAITNRKRSLTSTPSLIVTKVTNKKKKELTNFDPPENPSAKPKSNPRRKKPTKEEIFAGTTIPLPLATLDNFVEQWKTYVEIKQSIPSKSWKTLLGAQAALDLADKEFLKKTDVLAALEQAIAGEYQGVQYQAHRQKSFSKSSVFTRQRDEKDVVDDYWSNVSELNKQTEPCIVKEVNKWN